MKWALVFFITVIFKGSADLQAVRQLYQNAEHNEKNCKQLLSLLSKSQNRDPVFEGYEACATMMMANHVFNPIAKLKYFKRGKEMLEKAINRDPENCELRFLRFGVQTNIPSFLGYKSEIEKDKKFLIKHTFYLEDQYLKKWITSFLLDSSYVKSEEKVLIQNKI